MAPVIAVRTLFSKSLRTLYITVILLHSSYIVSVYFQINIFEFEFELEFIQNAMNIYMSCIDVETAPRDQSRSDRIDSDQTSIDV